MVLLKIQHYLNGMPCNIDGLCALHAPLRLILSRPESKVCRLTHRYSHKNASTLTCNGGA